MNKLTCVFCLTESANAIAIFDELYEKRNLRGMKVLCLEAPRDDDVPWLPQVLGQILLVAVADRNMPKNLSEKLPYCQQFFVYVPPQAISKALEEAGLVSYDEHRMALINNYTKAVSVIRDLRSGLRNKALSV